MRSGNQMGMLVLIQLPDLNGNPFVIRKKMLLFIADTC